MSPIEKVKWLILNQVYKWNNQTLDYPLDNIQELFDSVENTDPDNLQDATSSVRCGVAASNIEPEYSRNFETKSVADKLPDGSWVGWTYYYGGGKHASPEYVEWISDAYDLACVEEEKMIIIQTFTKLTGSM